MTETTGDDDVPTIRRAVAEDRAGILETCRVSLKWDDGDPNEAFFAWKHDENPFGASPTWVAVDDSGRVVGVRCFLRWRFRTRDGALVDAVRAVDTATHPDARGLGVFRSLTLGALPELERSGIGFVFNTPNDQSGPGYLKMGWVEVGRVPLGVRPSSLRYRRASEGWSGSDKWGQPTDVGVTAAEAFADDAAVARLLDRTDSAGRIRTDRSPEFLRWRYGFEPLQYRVLCAGDSIDAGAVVFRLRRRGARVDATICDELLPPGARRRSLYRQLARRTGADLLLRAQDALVASGPFVRIDRLGPRLYWRTLARPGTPDLGELALTYGDLELF